MQDAISNQQSAYHIERVSQTDDVDRNVYEAMRVYLADDLGVSEDIARSRAEQELQRRIPKAAVAALTSAGVVLKDADVLDLGSGLGAMSEELALCGARVVSLEPGAAWASLPRRRVERHTAQFRLLEAFGEAIPLPSASMDVVVSLQVLEHVQDPQKVLSEAWRVLRPGGSFYLACENYLAFREAHYQLPWLPLLPKRLGSLYLRALGRSPDFLNNAVTYTTYPAVLRDCRRLGFVRRRDEEVELGLRAKPGMKWKLLRALAAVGGAKLPLWLDRSRYTFKLGLYELFRKPAGGGDRVEAGPRA